VQLPTLRAAIGIRKPSRTEEEIVPINIRVDADVGGKKIKFVFNWEGTSEEIQNVVDLVERAAKLGDVSPRSFAYGTLKYLPATGVMENEDECQVQMAAIVYTVLTCVEEELIFPRRSLNSPSINSSMLRYAERAARWHAARAG
jgi:hypothetical protein